MVSDPEVSTYARMGRHYGVRPGGSDTYEEIRMILTEEQLLIQETARKFAQERSPRIRPNGSGTARFRPGFSGSWASWGSWA